MRTATLNIDGLSVGHWTDFEARTGCTVVLCRDGAVAGVDVRGAAPGTRETDLMRGYNAVERINAILLTGGSAFGLDAAAGVMQYLELQGRGVKAGPTVVPIVPGAVIFDLDVGDGAVRPQKENGYTACTLAGEAFETGSVGAGTGATVGKTLGMHNAMRGGIGAASVTLEGGVIVSALVVVNALGDIYDPRTGRIVAGAKKDGVFVPYYDHAWALPSAYGNTTIGVVATNARLDREQANKLASMAHDGLAMTVRPTHTNFDGDTFFALSTCEKGEVPMLPLMNAAVRAVSDAVIDAVR
ncbi:MAG: P1 family peptidase [Bacillota bacterium]